MTFNNTTLPNNFDAQSNARASSIAFVDAFMGRDPTVNDINYQIQKKWLNTTTGALWELQNFTTSEGILFANWILIASHGLVTETLTGNDGIIVGPTNNNIDVVGDVTNILTTGNAATSTLTINLNGNVATTYVENTGSATPSGHVLNVLGTNGITTVGSGNTITIEPTSGNLFEGNTVDAHTAPGTNPVVPNGSGLITVTGGQVAAGTTANVIETNSLAANTYTIDIQRSQAVASSTIGDNGVSHFNSSIFSVDANGFVSIASAFYRTGTWSPNLAFGGASVGITYGVQYGEYTVIGNLVFYTAYIELTSKGSSSGTAIITNLPFTSINAAHVASGTMGTTNLTFPSGTTAPYVSVTPNTTDLQLLISGSGTGATSLADTNFSNTTHLDISGFYFTS
jgi:hypothetical protein